MHRHPHCLIGTLLLALFVFASHASAQQRRNPFGLPDVPGADDEGARAFADQLKFPALGEDPNALAWPSEASADNPMKFDGTWAGRWNSQGTDGWSVGNARVAKQGRGLFIHYFSGEQAEGGYLIEAVRRDDGLYVGRYSVAGQSSASGLWAGRVVSHERIDGFWTATGRWDFRRKFE